MRLRIAHLATAATFRVIWHVECLVYEQTSSAAGGTTQSLPGLSASIAGLRSPAGYGGRVAPTLDTWRTPLFARLLFAGDKCVFCSREARH
jgi:hypothetical protein